MKKLLLIVIIALLPITAEAGTFGKYGIGIGNSGKQSQTEVKSLSFGYNEKIIHSLPFMYQYEVGMWTDTAGYGRKGSGFGAASLGLEINPGYFVIRSLWGVGVITHKDAYLGGNLQFNQDLLLGVRDSSGTVIGINYKHISSAGIWNPNVGRDLLSIQLELPW